MNSTWVTSSIKPYTLWYWHNVFLLSFFLIPIIVSISVIFFAVVFNLFVFNLINSNFLMLHFKRIHLVEAKLNGEIHLTLGKKLVWNDYLSTSTMYIKKNEKLNMQYSGTGYSFHSVCVCVSFCRFVQIIQCYRRWSNFQPREFHSLESHSQWLFLPFESYFFVFFFLFVYFSFFGYRCWTIVLLSFRGELEYVHLSCAGTKWRHY